METAYLKSKIRLQTICTQVHVHPILKNSKKCYFKVPESFEILFFMYILCTYLFRFRHKKTAMCDLHINVKMEFPILVNILSFSCRPHTIEFFHENLHKYWHNMYMKKSISIFFLDFQIAFFPKIGETRCTCTQVHPGISHQICS